VTSGLIIAAPSSGSGKTVLTLSLLRAFAKREVAVSSIKVGPDFIDPQFHAVSTGRPCLTLDLWAMRPETVAHQVAAAAGLSADLIIAEGVMGLFDGASDGSGSTADAASRLGWPVVLVLDVKGQAESAAAVAHGFASYRDDVSIAGVICNRVGSDFHAELLRRAFDRLGMPVLGCIPNEQALTLPDRHLGLVQAIENQDIAEWVDQAADTVSRHVDLESLRKLARPALSVGLANQPEILSRLSGPIAVAQDAAFSFLYPHILSDWSASGQEITFFSPLADERPSEAAQTIFLPGGYPELHAGRLATNRAFLGGLRDAAGAGKTLYGECGGYMVLGERLEDASGQSHAMAGLLPVTTSMKDAGLSLGYRKLSTLSEGPLGHTDARFRGHEFHYSRETENRGDPLFHAVDARGQGARDVGCRVGAVMGSYMHLVDRS
jgi:cobyrinic acid a,c-diamide synthase